MTTATIQFLLDGVDITDDVVIAATKLLSAAQGDVDFSTLAVKNVGGVAMSFGTGAELICKINGQKVYRGFRTRRSRQFWFAVDDPTKLRRLWGLTFVDHNYIFEKRVVYDKSNPSSADGKIFEPVTYDDEALAELFANWVDMTGDGIDVTTRVDRVADITWGQEIEPFNPSFVLGDALHTINMIPQAVFAIDPDQKFIWADVDDEDAPFELSDDPGPGQSGYRDCTIIENGEELITDVLGWGFGKGIEHGVFSRLQDTSEHGRWQFATKQYGIWHQETLDKVTDSILNGSPSSKRGHKDNKLQIQLTTFAHGFRVAQRPRFVNTAWGYDLVIPIRKLEISFPSGEPMYKMVLSHGLDEPWSTYEPVPIPQGGIPDIPVPGPPPEPPCIFCDCVGPTLEVPDQTSIECPASGTLAYVGYAKWTWSNAGGTYQSGTGVSGGGNPSNGAHAITSAGAKTYDHYSGVVTDHSVPAVVMSGYIRNEGAAAANWRIYQGVWLDSNPRFTNRGPLLMSSTTPLAAGATIPFTVEIPVSHLYDGATAVSVFQWFLETDAVSGSNVKIVAGANTTTGDATLPPASYCAFPVSTLPTSFADPPGDSYFGTGVIFSDRFDTDSGVRTYGGSGGWYSSVTGGRVPVDSIEREDGSPFFRVVSPTTGRLTGVSQLVAGGWGETGPEWEILALLDIGTSGSRGFSVGTTPEFATTTRSDDLSWPVSVLGQVVSGVGQITISGPGEGLTPSSNNNFRPVDIPNQIWRETTVTVTKKGITIPTGEVWVRVAQQGGWFVKVWQRGSAEPADWSAVVVTPPADAVIFYSNPFTGQSEGYPVTDLVLGPIGAVGVSGQGSNYSALLGLTVFGSSGEARIARPSYTGTGYQLSEARTYSGGLTYFGFASSFSHTSGAVATTSPPDYRVDLSWPHFVDPEGLGLVSGIFQRIQEFRLPPHVHKLRIQGQIQAGRNGAGIGFGDTAGPARIDLPVSVINYSTLMTDAGTIYAGQPLVTIEQAGGGVSGQVIPWHDFDVEIEVVDDIVRWGIGFVAFDVDGGAAADRPANGGPGGANTSSWFCAVRDVRYSIVGAPWTSGVTPGTPPFCDPSTGGGDPYSSLLCGDIADRFIASDIGQACLAVGVTQMPQTKYRAEGTDVWVERSQGTAVAFNEFAHVTFRPDGTTSDGSNGLCRNRSGTTYFKGPYSRTFSFVEFDYQSPLDCSNTNEITLDFRVPRLIPSPSWSKVGDSFVFEPEASLIFGGWNQGAAIEIFFNADGGRIDLSSGSSVTVSPLPAAIVPGVWVKTRLRYEPDGRVKFRVWKETDPEPSTWLINTIPAFFPPRGFAIYTDYNDFIDPTWSIDLRNLNIHNLAASNVADPTLTAGYTCETVFPDGAGVVTLGNAYAPGSVDLFVDGKLEEFGVAYVETSPTTGVVTIDSDTLADGAKFVACYLIKEA